MDVIRGDVRKLVNKELNAANKRFRPFASPHEGQGIVREELEEVEQAICRWKSTSRKGCGTQSRQTKPFRRKNFTKSGKWLFIWR